MTNNAQLFFLPQRNEIKSGSLFKTLEKPYQLKSRW